MEPIPVPVGGDRNRASALLAIFWAPYPITAALICARLFVRLRISSLKLDDYSMFLAWILYTVSTSLASVCMVEGGARHLFYLQPEEIVKVLKYNFLSQPFGAMSSALGKASVAFLILRIIGPNNIWQKRFALVNVALYLAITVISIIVTFVQCRPARSLWDPVAGSKCINPNISVSITITQSAYGTFMDFVLALLPITIIRGLKIDLRKKLGLCALLGLGIFAGICAAIKTAQLHAYGSRQDFTWAVYSIFAWSSIEIALVIICGCIPTVKPLFDSYINGKPLRPFHSAEYRGETAYRMQSPSDTSGKTTLIGNQSGTSTKVSATDRSDTSLSSRAIRVDQGVDINHSDLDVANEEGLR